MDEFSKWLRDLTQAASEEVAVDAQRQEAKRPPRASGWCSTS